MAYDFPEDLLQLQREWYAARLAQHELYARLPLFSAEWAQEDAAAVEELLERERTLAEKIGTHPAIAEAANGHEARMALKNAVRPEGWSL